MNSSKIALSATLRVGTSTRYFYDDVVIAIVIAIRREATVE